jgi:hypothetical protein
VLLAFKQPLISECFGESPSAYRCHRTKQPIKVYGEWLLSIEQNLRSKR